MNVRHFLDAATGHLSPEDVALLDAAAKQKGTLPFDAMAYEYGWIVSTASLIDGDARAETIRELRQCGLSEAFISIADRAGRLGCWLLRFDLDEDLDPRVPIGGYGLEPEDMLLLQNDDFKDDVEMTYVGGSCPVTASESGCGERDEGSPIGRVRAVDAGATTGIDAFGKLMVLRALQGGDTETTTLEWRRHLADGERERCLLAGYDLPAFRLCPDWRHQFAEGAPERTVRWSFDRRSWSLAHLEILDETTGAWRASTNVEHVDVDESLVTANLEALTGDPEDWGCTDVEQWPTTMGDERPGCALGVSVAAMG